MRSLILGTASSSPPRRGAPAFCLAFLTALLIVALVGGAGGAVARASGPSRAAAQAGPGRILFIRDGTLYSIRPDGADERALAPIKDPLIPGETLRGTTAVLHGKEQPTRLLDVASGVEHTLPGAFVSLKGVEGERTAYLGGSFVVRYGLGPSEAPLVLSEDGRLAAGVRGAEAGFDVVLIDAENAAVSVLVPLEHRPWLLKFLPGGTRLLVVTGDPTLLRAGPDLLVDLTTGQATALPPPSSPLMGTFGAAASPDGRKIALRDSEELRLIDATSLSTVWSRALKAGFNWLAFSRDGSRVFATEYFTECGTRVVMLTADSAGTASALACEKDAGLFPYVVDDATLAIANGVVVFNMVLDVVTTASAQRRRLTSDAFLASVQASSDGQTRLVSDTKSQGQSRLTLQKPDGTLVRELAQSDSFPKIPGSDWIGWGDGSFSPDGRAVVFGCDRQGRLLVCISPVSEADGAPRVLTPGAAPIWLP